MGAAAVVPSGTGATVVVGAVVGIVIYVTDSQNCTLVLPTVVNVGLASLG